MTESKLQNLLSQMTWESFGEDHLLSGALEKAMIEGYQGSESDLLSPESVAACLKHFAGYGAPEGGKDYGAVDMSWREFYGYYARPYEIAMQAKPRMVMSSFNSLNGEPVTGSAHILKEVLRKQFGFEGLVISDWGAVEELKNHGVAEDDRQAAAAALGAGVDIEMVSATYFKHGEELIQENPELETQINEAVMKVLKLKNDLGLFEQPYAAEEEEENRILTKEARELAKDAAIKSCVLLKNEGILPFHREKKHVILLGPFAGTRELLGNWACKGSFGETVSLQEGIKELMPGALVGAYEEINEGNIQAIKTCDALIVTLGEHYLLSGEGHSSTRLELDEGQKELLLAVSQIRKDYACVAFSGRPLALEPVIHLIPSLLWGWFPGTMAGDSIAALLFGKVSPSGRLSMSFPRVNGQGCVRYNEYRSGRPAGDSSYSNRYQDCSVGALFPFGWGLSYTEISYEGISFSSHEISEEQSLEIRAEVVNKGEYSCFETVILFMEDVLSGIVRPSRELLQF